jgi:hypothetical protein
MSRRLSHSISAAVVSEQQLESIISGIGFGRIIYIETCPYDLSDVYIDLRL